MWPPRDVMLTKKGCRTTRKDKLCLMSRSMQHVDYASLFMINVLVQHSEADTCGSIIPSDSFSYDQNFAGPQLISNWRPLGHYANKHTSMQYTSSCC